ncbi:MAG: TlpA family protein disulfide reductase [Clostridiales bacterium]|nr:TlpA family protein disulfide reductase [Clostridiales bacterium]
MKRTFFRSVTVITALMLCLSLVSCSGSKKQTSSGDDPEETEITTTEETTGDTTGYETGALEPEFDPDFKFSTTDRDGNVYDQTVFAEHEVTMINFWEPWCGPCVGEMPELESLYEDYSDQGLLIIGVYSDMSMEDSVDDVLSSSGITYPILHYTGEFDQFQSGYVPTTIFVDRQGHVLTPSSGDQLVVGSNSYSEWADIIEEFL